MPKVRPLTQEQREKNRWKKADTNFAAQIGALLEVSKLTELQLAWRLGIKCQQTMRKKIDHPATLKKIEERKLAETFEEFGLKYDFTMGEGGAGNAAVAR
jgi:hypothetical protein